MEKSYATGWVSDSPTPAQLSELFLQIKRGQVTKSKLQGLLNSGALLKEVGIISVQKTNDIKLQTAFSTENEYGVPITCVHDKFRANFKENIVSSHESISIRSYLLTEKATDLTIISGLGEQYDLTIDYVFSLLVSESKIQNPVSILISTGMSNLFYVRDDQRKLCVVYIRWSHRGWEIGCVPAFACDPWEPGCLVFHPFGKLDLELKQNPVTRFTFEEAKSKIGKIVRTISPFAGVGKDVLGKVVSIFEAYPNEFDIMFEWETKNGEKCQDRFAKSDYFAHLIELGS